MLAIRIYCPLLLSFLPRRAINFRDSCRIELMVSIQPSKTYVEPVLRTPVDSLGHHILLLEVVHGASGESRSST